MTGVSTVTDENRAIVQALLSDFFFFAKATAVGQQQRHLPALRAEGQRQRVALGPHPHLHGFAVGRHGHHQPGGTMHRHLSILAALMLLTATSLHAAPISIGTSFGYSHFSEASGGGSGLNAFGWPSTNVATWVASIHT